MVWAGMPIQLQSCCLGKCIYSNVPTYSAEISRFPTSLLLQLLVYCSWLFPHHFFTQKLLTWFQMCCMHPPIDSQYEQSPPHLMPHKKGKGKHKLHVIGVNELLKTSKEQIHIIFQFSSPYGWLFYRNLKYSFEYKMKQLFDFVQNIFQRYPYRHVFSHENEGFIMLGHTWHICWATLDIHAGPHLTYMLGHTWHTCWATLDIYAGPHLTYMLGYTWHICWATLDIYAGPHLTYMLGHTWHTCWATLDMHAFLFVQQNFPDQSESFEEKINCNAYGATIL